MKMITMSPITAPTPTAVDPLAHIIDLLEAQLHKKPPCRGAKPVIGPEDLIPIVLADRVTWRHTVTGDGALLAARVVADSLDAAYTMICAARQSAPRAWQTLSVQAAGYAAFRSQLGGVANALAWALEVATGDAVVMSVQVGRTFVRSETGRRVPLASATLVLRDGPQRG